MFTRVIRIGGRTEGDIIFMFPEIAPSSCGTQTRIVSKLMLTVSRSMLTSHLANLLLR